MSDLDPRVRHEITALLMSEVAEHGTPCCRATVKGRIRQPNFSRTPLSRVIAPEGMSPPWSGRRGRWQASGSSTGRISKNY
jgi:hypothetical protein